MAERVDAMPHANLGGSRYPWDEWLDGSAWELIRGKDFECSLNAIRASVKSAAASRGLVVQIVTRGDRVYLQAQR